MDLTGSNITHSPNILIKGIVQTQYPYFFDCCHELVKLFEAQPHTPCIAEAKSQLDLLSTAVDRQFSKERIVLFPFLIKQLSNSVCLKNHLAIATAQEETAKLSQSLSHFESWLANKFVANTHWSTLRAQLNALRRACDTIESEKQKLFTAVQSV